MVTRVGHFWNGLGNEFSYKCSPNVWQLYLLFWRMLILYVTILGQLLEKNIPTSVHTGWVSQLVWAICVLNRFHYIHISIKVDKKDESREEFCERPMEQIVKHTVLRLKIECYLLRKLISSGHGVCRNSRCQTNFNIITLCWNEALWFNVASHVPF